jgi:2-iminobutanoate/2-iminopropanoate deaminase
MSDAPLRRAVAGSPATGAYSPGLLVQGTLLFVSGQGPLVDGEIRGGTIEEQTQLTLENLAAVLAAGGATPDDVVRCTVYLADLADFAAMDAVFARFFGEPRPTRTTVGAQLLDIGVEIDCIAVVGATP